MYMKREGIIFMNEGGRDSGISEIKPAMPAPVEGGGPTASGAKDKSRARQVESPGRIEGKKDKKAPDPKIASVKEYFDKPDSMKPEVRKIVEAEKIDVAADNGQVDKVSILELGKFFIDEAVNVFRSREFSPRAKNLIDSADGFIENKISGGEGFEEEFFKKLGKGDIDKGKERWATLREIKRDVFGEGDEGTGVIEKATDAKPEEQKASSKAASDEVEKGIDEISEISGLDREDLQRILSAAPIDEESVKKLFGNIEVLPSPIQPGGGNVEQVLRDSAERDESSSIPLSQAAPVSSETGSGAGNATSQAEGGSGGGGGDEGNGGSRSMGAGVPAAPMGSGDYEQYDGDGGRGKNKFREGDRHKRLKDFLKRHFGKEALLIYALMLLALYCGAVYHTARVLEENAERSRAGRSSL